MRVGPSLALQPQAGKPLSSCLPPRPRLCHGWFAGPPSSVSVFFCLCPHVPPVLGVLAAPPTPRKLETEVFRNVPAGGSAPPPSSRQRLCRGEQWCLAQRDWGQETLRRSPWTRNAVQTEEPRKGRPSASACRVCFCV